MPPDNRITLSKLEVFCTVVEVGGVRRAAEELFITQPVVSAHLRSLQERIGAELFHRDGRGISLTEAGVEVHIWAKEVLRGRLDLDSKLKNLSAGMSGAASIATTMTAGTHVLPPILIGFRRRYTQAAITLSISSVEAAIDRVLSGQVDLAVIATDAVLGSDALHAELLAEPRFALIAAGDSSIIGASATPEQLSQVPFVCPPGGRAMSRSQDLALASIGVRSRRVAIELGNAESMKQAVAADLGVALVWRAAIDAELASGVLREVAVDGADFRDKLYLVQRAGKRLTPLQGRLTDEIRAGVASRCASDGAAADAPA